MVQGRAISSKSAPAVHKEQAAMQRPDNMAHSRHARAALEAVRLPVSLTGYTRCGMGIWVVLIEAWAWGRTRRPQGGGSPRFYTTFPLSFEVARLLLREDTAQSGPAAVPCPVSCSLARSSSGPSLCASLGMGEPPFAHPTGR